MLKHLLIVTLFFIFGIKGYCSELLQKQASLFFEDLRTFEADFVQEADDEHAYGKVYLSKPHKIRFDYISPFKSRLIVNRKRATYYDIDLDEINSFSVEHTMLKLFIKNGRFFTDLSFDKAACQERNNYVYVKTKYIVKSGKTGDFTVTFIFNKNIDILYGIVVEDNLDNKMTLNFEHIRINQDIKDDIFNLKNIKKEN